MVNRRNDLVKADFEGENQQLKDELQGTALNTRSDRIMSDCHSRRQCRKFYAGSAERCALLSNIQVNYRICIAGRNPTLPWQDNYHTRNTVVSVVHVTDNYRWKANTYAIKVDNEPHSQPPNPYPLVVQSSTLQNRANYPDVYVVYHKQTLHDRDANVFNTCIGPSLSSVTWMLPSPRRVWNLKDLDERQGIGGNKK